MWSVLLSKHNRERARRFCRVGRVLRAELHVRVEIVDLEKELAAGELEIAEIVLAMRVVIVIELRECRHAPDHHRLDVRGQGIDASRHEHSAAGHRRPETVVQLPDALGAHQMRPAKTSAETTVLVPQDSQYPCSWSGSISAV